MRAYHCHFIFSFLVVFVSLFLFLCVSVYHLQLVAFCNALLSFLFLNILCVCSTFLFHDYHKVCMKHLTEKTADSNLSSLVSTGSVIFLLLFIFLWPQISLFMLLVCYQVVVAIVIFTFFFNLYFINVFNTLF